MGDGLNPTQVLTANIGTVMDADNVSSAGVIVSPVSWSWKVELDPGTGVFTNLIRVDAAADDVEATGETLVLLPEDNGLLMRVEARFQDDTLNIESVTSGSVLIAGDVAAPPVVAAVLTIGSANYIGRQSRLRVMGTTDIGANVSLFAPSTSDGVTCSGTAIASQIAVAGTYEFDQKGFGANPGSVCVSVNGLAVDSAV